MALNSDHGSADDTEYRIEHDTMGEVRVPAKALWRAQTQRAVENFPISGRGLERTQIRALGLLKGACAQVNKDLGLLAPEKAARPGRFHAAEAAGTPLLVEYSKCSAVSGCTIGWIACAAIAASLKPCRISLSLPG